MFPCGGKKKPKKKKPTPSQLHFEAPLRTVATVFPSVYVAVLATRFGEPIARLPRETQHPVNPDFDDREFEDIPKELRDLDDKMTGGEMEYRELMVGVAMAVRVSRRFVATALDRPLLLKLREQMAQHRERSKCAVCHVRMDALGLSLERFDAVGRYRVTDKSGPIDASSALACKRSLSPSSAAA